MLPSLMQDGRERATRKMQGHNTHALGRLRSHTSFPPFALQIVVLEAGAVLIVTVTVGCFVTVDVVLTIVYLVFVFVGVGWKVALACEIFMSGQGHNLQQ